MTVAQWDQIRFNVFPSREAFMEVVLDPERLAAQAAHRETAIADTYTLITRPIDRSALRVDHGRARALPFALMIKLTVSYPNGEGTTFDHDYYKATPRPDVHRTP